MDHVCVFCGALGDHAMVGIGRKNLVDNQGVMVAHPVCGVCHNNPSDRPVSYKLHFHGRSHAVVAVETARRLDVLSRSGKDLSL